MSTRCQLEVALLVLYLHPRPPLPQRSHLQVRSRPARHQRKGQVWHGAFRNYRAFDPSLKSGGHTQASIFIRVPIQLTQTDTGVYRKSSLDSPADRKTSYYTTGRKLTNSRKIQGLHFQ